MITIPFKDCNSFSQAAYDEMTDGLQLQQLQCKCGHKGYMILYGHYKRRLKLFCSLVTLMIQRVKCGHCGRTHALIPSLIVPYSQIPLEDQQDILKLRQDGASPEPVLERNVLIDESHVRHIIRRFRKHWEQRILSIGLTLAESLSRPCILNFGLQFMQVHRTWNSFFRRQHKAARQGPGSAL